MGMAKMVCVDCKKEFDLKEMYRCPEDHGELTFTYDYDKLGKSEAFHRAFFGPGRMWDRFFDILPLRERSHIVSLSEGSTPLVHASRLGDELGVKNLYLKLESCNPTGSFKDRQMTVALSNGNEWGRKNYCTVSSGNVGNALSAYSASHGFSANVWVSDDTARTKYEQIEIYGAQLFLFPSPAQNGVEFHEHFFGGLSDFCAKNGMVPTISARPVNPYMVEGTKTISFEIFAELGHLPEYAFMPIGGGGMFGGSWKGYRELHKLGFTDGEPKCFGCQRDGYMVPIPHMDDPTFDTTGYAKPLDGLWAKQSLDEGNGVHMMVTDSEIIEAQKLLATREGVFAEPQGAHATAGLIKAARAGKLRNAESVVCVITGNGLKDMPTAEKMLQDQSLYSSVQRVRSFDDCAGKLKKG